MLSLLLLAYHTGANRAQASSGTKHKPLVWLQQWWKMLTNHFDSLEVLKFGLTSSHSLTLMDVYMTDL